MIYLLSTVFMSPLFYVQGKYVRRVTPQLTEPDGDREGTSGAGRKLSLLIVGDSAAAGVGVEQQSQALSGYLVRDLSDKRSVSWKLLANTGDTSGQLLSSLLRAPDGDYEFVVVSIGVNDVTSLTSSKTWLDNLDAVVNELVQKFGTRKILFSGLPPMHRFPALPQPLRWWLGLRAQRMNRLLQTFTENHAKCAFVAMPALTEVEYIASDGFHPSEPAYRLWAAGLADVLCSELFEK